MSEAPYRFTVEPRILTEEEILGISDPSEKRFALIAHRAGMEVRDGGMITLSGKKINKQDKRSTNPDFLVNGVFIEITEGENLGSRKARQKSVMTQTGLPYLQLTGSQITELSQKKDLQEALNELLKHDNLEA